MKTKFLLFVLVLLSIFSLSSCASKQKAPRERSETYIADLAPFYVDELHLYTKTTIGNPKITDIEVSFSPRSNAISFKMKIGLDVIRIVFSYSERQKLFNSAEQYIDDYNNDLLEDVKPTKKNALIKSELPVSWGVFGMTHDVKVKYITNVEFLEAKKPYYRIKFDATTDPEDGSTTPAFCIYISPSQWQTIFEMCDQATLEARCDEIVEQAEAF